MNILITGANGFVGQNLLKKLQDHNVSLLLRKKHPLLSKQYQCFYGDLSQQNILEQAVKKQELVINLAACTKALKAETFFEVNSQGTQNLLKACQNQGKSLKHFIHISSLAASGPDSVHSKPESRLDCANDQTISLYGKSKSEADQFIQINAHAFHFKTSILRPSIVYGPHDMQLLQLFQFLKKTRLHIHPNGSDQYFSFIYVHDFCQAIIETFNSSQNANASVYYLSHSQPSTFVRLANLIAQNADITIKHLKMPSSFFKLSAHISEFVGRFKKQAMPFNLDKFKEMQATGWTCSSKSFTKAFQYTPNTSLENGIQETHAWYKENGLI